jgi:hypothetical protein
MTDRTMELLREFRADAPEPDETQQARAFRRAIDARERGPGDARRARMVDLRARFGGRVVVVTVGVAAAVAAVAIVLIAPGKDGPGSLNQAQAATIVRHVIAAVQAPSVGIFHERFEIVGVPFAGAGRTVRATDEVWQESGGSQRYRAVNEAIVPPVPIELAFSADAAGLAIFDPRTNAIHRVPRSYALEPVGPSSSASALSDIAESLRKGPNGFQLALGWAVTRTKLAGRDVYRVSNAQPSRSGPTGMTYYVDAATYVPIQVEEPGPPKNQPGGPRSKPGTSFSIGPRSPASLTVTRILIYEHLDPSQANLAELDLQQAHPTARELPFASLRPDVKERLRPISTPTQLPPTAPTPGTTTRLTIDPERGSIGDFHIGDKLLQLAPLLTAPVSNFPVLPGNLQDGAATGLLDQHGILVVTFRDAAQEHSTSAYLTRPFRTTRGDVNSIGSDASGTTLEDFLSHWPDHGTPTPSVGKGGNAFTTVKVGRATFFFSSDDRLSAVQLGDGDAASYAGFGG